MKAPVSEQLIRINRRAAARLRQGHVWVYRSDLLGSNQVPSEAVPSSAAATATSTNSGTNGAKSAIQAESARGGLVSVADENGNLLGTALFSSSSQIALRMLSAGPVSADALPDLIRDRLLAAVALRERLMDGQAHTNGYRLVFGEADRLPGVIVDRYNDILALQSLTQAMDQPWVRELVVSTLVEQVGAAAIVERVDARVRELEQLPSRDSALLWGEKTETVFSLNGIRLHYQALAGQKTGAFLDQRENYAAAARHARGDALDVFCYQGGFALHLARRCDNVTAVDSSRPALEMAEANATLNPDLKPVEWIEGNAFDLLKDYSSSGRQYDTIVLDPPAFARARRELPAALRGYKELNLRALKMLRPGGVLVTCSCSFHLSAADFLEVLRSAAADVRRSPRVLEKRGQAADHPVLLTVPETAYLKCVVLQV